MAGSRLDAFGAGKGDSIEPRPLQHIQQGFRRRGCGGEGRIQSIGRILGDPRDGAARRPRRTYQVLQADEVRPRHPGDVRVRGRRGAVVLRRRIRSRNPRIHVGDRIRHGARDVEGCQVRAVRPPDPRGIQGHERGVRGPVPGRAVGESEASRQGEAQAMEPRAVFRTDGMFKAEMAAFAAVFSIIAWLLVRGAGMLRCIRTGSGTRTAAPDCPG